jgi:hypothetical protein
MKYLLSYAELTALLEWRLFEAGIYPADRPQPVVTRQVSKTANWSVKKSRYWGKDSQQLVAYRIVADLQLEFDVEQ